MRQLMAVPLFLYAISTAVAGDTGSNMAAWLGAPLYGSDNQYAALRKVTIRKVGGGYRINIRNQFNFECELAFNEQGDPALLSNCVSKDKPQPICNPDRPDSFCATRSGCFRAPNEQKPHCFRTWVVVEKQVALACSAAKTERVCRGSYTLGTNRDPGEPDRFTIARKLK